MSTPIIEIEGIGKKYRIGGQRERYLSLREEIAKTVRRLRTKDHGRNEDFWALRDVSFSVNEGEAVGIIGRNGAGKSTLLKILSQITPPTEGRITMHGRVASLLEVGTGFHPELTGRENVYLNGAILGMTRAEVKRKFDEIVAFAETEKFLDTPVKRYSSGMYVRLAFAIAAHLEPEILLVDEVLAVGDAEFQKKCLGKMQDVAEGGRTVIFVSHNMAAISRLCHRAIIVDQGSIAMDAEAEQATAKYLQSGAGTMAERHWDLRTAPGDDVATLRAVRVLNLRGEVAETIDIRTPVTIEMEFVNHKPGVCLEAAFSFFNDQDVHLFVSPDFSEPQWGLKPRPAGAFRTRCEIPGNLLAEGLITVVPEVSTSRPAYQIHFLERDCVSFQVVDKGEAGSVRAGWGRPFPGAVRPALKWQTSYLDGTAG
jgi:lipopolysaccharide transport system ATP-binding protein